MKPWPRFASSSVPIAFLTLGLDVKKVMWNTETICAPLNGFVPLANVTFEFGVKGGREDLF